MEDEPQILNIADDYLADSNAPRRGVGEKKTKRLAMIKKKQEEAKKNAKKEDLADIEDAFVGAEGSDDEGKRRTDLEVIKKNFKRKQKENKPFDSEQCDQEGFVYTAEDDMCCGSTPAAGEAGQCCGSESKTDQGGCCGGEKKLPEQPGASVPGTQKIYVKTFGCSHNVSDSEYMMGQLVQYGYRLVNDPTTADCILINSCTVKNPSQENLMRMVFDSKKIKKPVVVAGCVPQGDTMIEGLQDVSIIGTTQIDRVVEVVEETLKGNSVQLLKKKDLPELDLPKIRKNRFIEM